MIEQKKQIRLDMLNKRSIFAKENGKKASQKIVKTLLDNFVIGNKKQVFSLYYPIKDGKHKPTHHLRYNSQTLINKPSG